MAGGVHFQPSEWVRLVLILVAARFFWEIVENGRDLSWKDIGKAFLLIGVPLVLVLKEPDLGTSLTYLPVLVVGLFLGGIKWKQAAMLILALAGGGRRGAGIGEVAEAVPAGAADGVYESG